MGRWWWWCTRRQQQHAVLQVPRLRSHVPRVHELEFHSNPSFSSIRPRRPLSSIGSKKRTDLSALALITFDDFYKTLRQAYALAMVLACGFTLIVSLAGLNYC